MNITFSPQIYFTSNPRFDSFKKDVTASYNEVDTPEELNKLIDQTIY